MSFTKFAIRGVAVLGFLAIAMAACDAEAAHGRRSRRSCCYDPCCRPVCCETVYVEPVCTSSCDPCCDTCYTPCTTCYRTTCGCAVVETVVVTTAKAATPGSPAPASAGRSVMVRSVSSK